MTRYQTIEIVAPTKGRVHNLPRTMIDSRAQAAGLNGKMFYGVNQKEYGTSVYATGTGAALGTPVNYIFDAKFPNGNVLQVFTHTSVYRYTATADTFVVDSQTFTGTYENYWSGVMHDNKFIYSNGVAPIQVKGGVGTTGTDMASAVAVASYKAYGLSSFYDHLCLYRTNEGGTDYYKRIRWTAKGALTLTGTADFGSGTAGAIDLQDSEGELKCAVSFSGTIVVLALKSIHIQYWVGDSEVFRFTKVISGVGTPSRRGAVSYGNSVYFIGNESFYEYRGGSDLLDIGEPIRDVAFGEISRVNLKNAFVEYDDRYDEINFHVPADSTMPNVVWTYRLENKSWSRHENPYTAKGDSTRVTGTTIGDLVGSIGGLAFPIGDFYLEESAAVQLYADTSGYVVKKDPTRYSLAIDGTNVPQPFIYETPTLVGAEAKRSDADPLDKETADYTTTIKRWGSPSVEAIGQGTLDVAYSVDGGRTYTNFAQSPLTLSATGSTHELDLDLASAILDIRCSNTATNDSCGVSYLRIPFYPMGKA